MTRYIYGGPTAVVGRFGKLAKGTIVELTDEEAAAVANDATGNWGKVPVQSILPRNIKRAATSPYTVGTSEHGHVIKVVKGAGAFTVNLPTIVGLAIGYSFTLLIDEDSTDNNPVTVDADGSETIDGQATINLEASSGKTFYNTGVEWKTTVFAQ